MIPVKIDVTRVYQEVEKVKQRAKAIETFVNQKIEILDGIQPAIQNFMGKFGGTELILENMYSTGSVVNETYSADCGLIVHCILTFKKEYVNKSLLTQKLSTKWKELIPNTVSASFYDYQITGCVVKFTIYVK